MACWAEYTELNMHWGEPDSSREPLGFSTAGQKALPLILTAPGASVANKHSNVHPGSNSFLVRRNWKNSLHCAANSC